MLQKRAVRLIHKVEFLNHTNSLFLKSKIMKFCDIVEFQTVQMLYKARYKLLPGQIQRRFQERTGCYELRDELNFRTQKHSSTLKSFSPTVNGVQLWNKLEMELKRSPNINLFKYKYKQKTFEIYREQEMCYHQEAQQDQLSIIKEECCCLERLSFYCSNLQIENQGRQVMNLLRGTLPTGSKPCLLMHHSAQEHHLQNQLLGQLGGGLLRGSYCPLQLARSTPWLFNAPHYAGLTSYFTNNSIKQI